MQIHTVIMMLHRQMDLHAGLSSEESEADGTLKRLLFAMLATVIFRMAFLNGRVRTDGTEVKLGPCHSHLPTPYVALNMGHCLETRTRRRKTVI